MNEHRFNLFVNHQKIVSYSDIDFFSCKEINVAIQVDENETEIMEHITQLGLSRVNSIIIKCPKNESTFRTIPLSNLRMEYSTLVDAKTLCEMIGKKYHDLLSTKIWLAHENKRLQDNTVIENLFIKENQISESVELTLFVHPNKYIKDFCEEHHLMCFKEINVKFLTGQFSIDLFQQKTLATVGDLKYPIYQLKGIAPHLQSLFCYKFGDSELADSMELFSNPLDIIVDDSITINLIVKPAKEVQVIVQCAEHLHGEAIELNMKENDTIADVKQAISKVTNKPSSIICLPPLRLRYNFEFSMNEAEYFDGDHLWKLELSENNSIELFASLCVLVSIKATDSTIHQRSFPLFNFESYTVRHIATILEKEYRRFGYNPRLVEKPGISMKTKLKDIGEETVEFVSEPLSSKCILS